MTARLGATLLALTVLPAGAAGQARDTAVVAPLRAYLDGQVDAGAFPGGVIVVGYRGAVVVAHPFGRYGLDDPRPVSDSTLYDLASLTKVIGLTTATLMLVADGALTLDEPVVGRVPAFAGDGKDRVTVRHLLLHTSGLPAWRPLHLEANDRAEALALVHATPLEAAPGSRYVYSDLGAILLTEVVERASGLPLDSLLALRVTGPLGMTRTRFLPPDAWRSFIAPTEQDPWRGRLLRGEVHDENAARLGGVSGHAGLFASGADLARFAQWLLDAWHGRPTVPAVPADLTRQFTARQDDPPGSSRALGWDTPSDSSSAGHCLGARAFGHTGFTGTSLWLDPDRDLFVILLTNRVHPTRENPTIRQVRPAVADLAVRAVAGPAACPDPTR